MACLNNALLGNVSGLSSASCLECGMTLWLFCFNVVLYFLCVSSSSCLVAVDDGPDVAVSIWTYMYIAL